MDVERIFPHSFWFDKRVPRASEAQRDEILKEHYQHLLDRMKSKLEKCVEQINLLSNKDN